MECLQILDWFISRAFIIVLIFSLIHVITAIPAYLHALTHKAKKQETLLATQIEALQNQIILKRPKYTQELLDLITMHIDSEAKKFILSKKQVNEKYNVIAVDKDIEVIATKVFGFFRNEIYDSNMSLIEPDGFMEYIVKTTRVVLIQYIEDYLGSMQTT